MIFAHYDRTSGQIVQVNQASQPFEREGYGVAIVTEPAVLAAPHRILLHTVQMGEFGWDYASVEYTPTPLSVPDVKGMRDAELTATDTMMIPDRPLTDADRQAWRVYRQALRDLGSIQGAADMVKGWPKRPDGGDPVLHLRIRETSVDSLPR